MSGIIGGLGSNKSGTIGIWESGRVIQAVRSTYNTAAALGNNNFTTIFGQAITPTSTESKIYIHFELSLTYQSTAGTAIGMIYKIDSTNPSSNSPTITGQNTYWTTECGRLDIQSAAHGAPQFHSTMSLIALDEPKTTSVITYNAQFRRHVQGQPTSSYINNNSATSHVILMEVA